MCNVVIDRNGQREIHSHASMKLAMREVTKLSSGYAKRLGNCKFQMADGSKVYLESFEDVKVKVKPKAVVVSKPLLSHEFYRTWCDYLHYAE